MKRILFFSMGLSIALLYHYWHNACLQLGDKLPTLNLHAGEEMPRLCGCRWPDAAYCTLDVYTYGEDGELLPDVEQPRKALFLNKKSFLWNKKLVFHSWKK